jgi:hypothetical protein
MEWGGGSEAKIDIFGKLEKTNVYFLSPHRSLTKKRINQVIKQGIA